MCSFQNLRPEGFPYLFNNTLRGAEGRQDQVQLAEEFRVAMPERGVSFGEFVRYLQDLLEQLEQIAINALPLNK